MTAGPPTILLVEDDAVLAELVRTVLVDEGYAVSLVGAVSADAVRVAVNQLEPSCVLLDSAAAGDYGESWDVAAWAHERQRPVPVVMFSALQSAVDEALASTSARAQAAHFAAVVLKPFMLDELLETVARAVGLATPFDASQAANAERTAALKERLLAAGATNVETSSRREWATFDTPNGDPALVYWWQREGVYYVVRLTDGGPVLLGRLHDRETAIALALT